MSRLILNAHIYIHLDKTVKNITKSLCLHYESAEFKYCLGDIMTKRIIASSPQCVIKIEMKSKQPELSKSMDTSYCFRFQGFKLLFLLML